ncbi:unnamed protein product [Amoebophrya sp. A120]|nr:unnamed protein product [Amoebophrya sp. A120]|eukprot:GSA120T00014001001.1
MNAASSSSSSCRPPPPKTKAPNPPLRSCVKHQVMAAKNTVELIDYWSGNPAVALVEGVLKCKEWVEDETFPKLHSEDLFDNLPEDAGTRSKQLIVEKIGAVKPPPGLINPNNPSNSLVLLCSNVPNVLTPSEFCTKWMHMRTNVFQFTRVLHGKKPQYYMLLMALRPEITPRQANLLLREYRKKPYFGTAGGAAGPPFLHHQQIAAGGGTRAVGRLLDSDRNYNYGHDITMDNSRATSKWEMPSLHYVFEATVMVSQNRISSAASPAPAPPTDPQLLMSYMKSPRVNVTSSPFLDLFPQLLSSSSATTAGGAGQQNINSAGGGVPPCSSSQSISLPSSTSPAGALAATGSSGAVVWGQHHVVGGTIGSSSATSSCCSPREQVDEMRVQQDLVVTSNAEQDELLQETTANRNSSEQDAGGAINYQVNMTLTGFEDEEGDAGCDGRGENTSSNYNFHDHTTSSGDHIDIPPLRHPHPEYAGAVGGQVVAAVVPGSSCASSTTLSSALQQQVQVQHQQPQQQPPKENLLVLPPSAECMVCLETSDEISDLGGGVRVTLLCGHSFHSMCLLRWLDQTCPVCRFQQYPAPMSVQHFTSTGCEIELCEFYCNTATPDPENFYLITPLRMCLICGFTGCLPHALFHFETNPGHCYALDHATQKVFDYSNNEFAHDFLLDHDAGAVCEEAPPVEDSEVLVPAFGKMENSRHRRVEQQQQQSSSTLMNKEDLAPGKKMKGLKSKHAKKKQENAVIEFNQVLTRQMEEQRLYFEDLLDKKEQDVQSLKRDCLHRLEALSVEFDTVLQQEARKAAELQQAKANLETLRRKLEGTKKKKQDCEAEIEKYQHLHDDPNHGTTAPLGDALASSSSSGGAWNRSQPVLSTSRTTARPSPDVQALAMPASVPRLLTSCSSSPATSAPSSSVSKPLTAKEKKNQEKALIKQLKQEVEELKMNVRMKAKFKKEQLENSGVLGTM